MKSDFPSCRHLAGLSRAALCALASLGSLHAEEPSPVTGKHTFTLGTDDFLLDGKPVQIRSGELHPGRIPREYWRHRLQMVKASGLNTVAVYVFWNTLEEKEGVFDFKTGNRNIGEFLKMAQEEGLWVILRPGPYICGEWDLGGIPSYLMRDPKVNLRSSKDQNYLNAVQRYIEKFSKVVVPHLVTHGGSVVMVQVENEFGSFGDDKPYLNFLHDQWIKNGINVPFYTADGPSDVMMKNGTLPGVAVGLDSGTEEKHWTIAKKYNPDVPVFSSETYPGWLTHWGEKWQVISPKGMLKDTQWYMDNKKSFNFYVFHGGTNFGFMAGANDGGKGHYQADITSYDYDAIIDEQGRPTPKFTGLREIISKALPDLKLPPVPEPIPAMEIPEFQMKAFTTVWANLPQPIKAQGMKSFEELGQYNQGMMVYRLKLPTNQGGKLDFGKTGVRDYGLVFLDGKYIGKLDRNLDESSIDLPPSSNANPELDVLVEAMGHINFGRRMSDDHKGLLSPVKLGDTELSGWSLYPLPLDEKMMGSLKDSSVPADQHGQFFEGSFELDKVADTFIDLSNYKKGMVWVNGHNLGRFWEIGPQKHLYCPAPWLKQGSNKIVVLDLQQTTAAPISGKTTLK